MSNFLKLIRFPNLLIIALVQYVMRYFIIEPILGINRIKLQFSDVDFAILVLATVTMAAAGYIINDYFDTKADRFNKKDVIVGRKITRRVALAMHQVLTGISILLGGYVSYSVGHWQFVFIFFMAGGLLWFYSTSYKYYFLLGSILMAMVVATVPLLVVIYEIPPLNKTYADVLLASKTNFNYLMYWVGAFSFFAFFGVLIGQFIRDMLSLKGDQEIKRKSLPAVIGLKWTKVIIVVLILFLSVSVFGVWYQFLNAPVDKITPWYFGILIILPLILLAYRVAKFKEGELFKLGKFLLRFAFLAGISYAFVVNYIVNKL
ncbi:UbiA family prenyltransferase [Marinifilum sp. D737]|uniref:UbiA family prenyltransferase n=1 Tax=Marinifilum sp. D737 TaxID=2969628 RepID=UPI0022736B09|nr:UbiA family prenyltransferase [Marinifilum sp. D737]MCY1633335.1 UbiA family prenyltransferase [Marinifilum sp. D737]